MRTNYLKVCICHKYTTKIFNKNCLNQQYSCSSLKRLLQIWSSTFYGPFLWMGFNYLKVTDPRREDSLLFATKSPEIPGTESIYLWKLKGWVNLEFTQWFWTQDAWMWMLGYCSIWLRLMDAIQLSQGYRINTKRVCVSLQSPQQFLVLIWSTSEGWKSELTLEPPSGFEPASRRLRIKRQNH